MYLMVGTRSDIACIVGILSRFMEKPRIEHWNAVKRVLKYLRGTTNYGITFSCNSRNTMLVVYSDADFAGDIDRRLSTTGWVCFVNSEPIAWNLKRQTVTATSTTEAEFIALCSITKGVFWLRRLLKNLNNIQKKSRHLRQLRILNMWKYNNSFLLVRNNNPKKLMYDIFRQIIN